MAFLYPNSWLVNSDFISQALFNPEQGRRLLDGVVVLGTPTGTAKDHEIEIRNRDIVIIQTKAQRLGMYLLGQALFSRHLMAAFKPKSIETVAVCTKGDAVLEPIALQYGIKVVVYPVRSR